MLVHPYAVALGTGTAGTGSTLLQDTSGTVQAGISKEELKIEGHFDEILESARHALSEKDFAKVIVQAESALDLARQIRDPYQKYKAMDNALDCLGSSYIGMHKFQQAEAVYKRRLEVKRKYEEFESSIAGNLQMLGMLEAAQVHWEAAESFYSQSNKYLDDCIQHFKKSDDYDPQDIVANDDRRQKSQLLFYLAVAYSHEGKFGEALRSCDEAYLLGEKFHAKPASLIRIVEGAIGLINSSGQSSTLDTWRGREKALRSQVH
jgi:tetratricopeptide (TPR) repeat protein